MTRADSGVQLQSFSGWRAASPVRVALGQVAERVGGGGLVEARVVDVVARRRGRTEGDAALPVRVRGGEGAAAAGREVAVRTRHGGRRRQQAEVADGWR